jgi:multiple sugar transport system ATP-binding protein
VANVVFDHITKKFKGDVIAINDLNIEIEDKEFLVLVGPSGCGKTTALRCLAGLEKPTSGNLFIGGKIVNDIQPKERDIAMVFQSYALYPHMTVFDNMAFCLKLRKISRTEIKKRVERAASILEIENLLARKPRELSGGQRQRVAVGRAIVREPKVFLFDEPLSNLDAKLRVQMRAEISKLHQRLASTFIYVTHDQLEAMTTATRIAVMNDGVLQQLDTPQKIYDSPNNQFVAGFIGSPAMNFFAAKIERNEGGLLLDTGDANLIIPKNSALHFQNLIGKKVVFGIRPEDIYNPVFTPSGITTAEAECKVEVIESLGNEIIVYLIMGKQSFVARLDPRTQFRIGNKYKMGFNLANMHLFDPNQNPNNPKVIRPSSS